MRYVYISSMCMFLHLYVPPCICPFTCIPLHIYIPTVYVSPHVCLFIRGYFPLCSAFPIYILYTCPFHVYLPSHAFFSVCMSPACMFLRRYICLSIGISFHGVHFSSEYCIHIPSMCMFFRTYISSYSISSLCIYPSVYMSAPCIYPFRVYVPSVCMFPCMIVVRIWTPQTTDWYNR